MFYFLRKRTYFKGDIIDNFSFDIKSKNPIKISYYIGNILYDKVNEFIFISAPYTEFKIRFTFNEKPNYEIEFNIYSRQYIIETEYRNNMTNSTIITKTNIYRNGICDIYNSYMDKTI